MSVELDFRLAPNWKQMMPQKKWAELDNSDVRYYSFVGSIVFRVGGADFSADWAWIPLVDFGVSLTQALNALPETRDQVVEFTDSDEFIRVTLEGDLVAITCSYAPGRGRADLQYLQQAAHDYMRRLIKELGNAEPAIFEGHVMQDIAAKQTGDPKPNE